MPRLRSENGKHIVNYEGADHEFNSLTSAWMYIFALRHVISVVATNLKVKGRQNV
jgi:hypothetical protein